MSFYTVAVSDSGVYIYNCFEDFNNITKRLVDAGLIMRVMSSL